jgi:hypothetical protein
MGEAVPSATAEFITNDWPSADTRYPSVVGGFQRLRYLSGDGQRLLARDRAPPDAIGQRFPFDELEYQKRQRSDLDEVVESRARYTSPMPPTPRGPMIS